MLLIGHHLFLLVADVLLHALSEKVMKSIAIDKFVIRVKEGVDVAIGIADFPENSEFASSPCPEGSQKARSPLFARTKRTTPLLAS